MKKTLKRGLAIALAFCMMFNLFVFADTVDDGVEFTKTATLGADGSANIHMEVYTTGQVRNTSTTTPTDIVLVLDVSGSMDDDSVVPTDDATFDAVYGSTYNLTNHGFNDSDAVYRISDGQGGYKTVHYVGRDGFLGMGHEYYADIQGNYYYPELRSGVNTDRNRNYPVVQFYAYSDYKSHMEVLKEGATGFINQTAEKNAGITKDADKHRISIIKFADNSYYSGSGSTTDYNQAVIGNDIDGNGYNYTQVVSDFTVVDDTGKTLLTNAMDSLVAGGATAVDYGLQLAVAQLGKRTDAEGRNEVVIVFTDGEPNHSSGYSDSVAASAVTHARNLKNTGVIIYSIGGANTADSTAVGDNYNAFMHYLSNNFPSASASGSTITAGEGDVDGGYYMTASDDKDLNQIFDEILSQINFPTVELGPEARVIDTVSEYFHIPNGADSVTLTVADKTENDWGTPYEATGVTATVNGQTLSVSGFDFDANHVSRDGRGDNGDFFGRKLIIDVAITPNYADIDAAGLTDGHIPTNLGVALVVNSDGDAVDTAQSPVVEAKKVTYKIDGREVKSFYRFPGADVTVDGEPTREGHSFSGWSQTGIFTMPPADVVISGTFTALEYPVSYSYSGEVPAGARDKLPATEQYAYGKTVSVAGPVSIDGYTFSGWTPRQTALEVTEGQFTMPAYAVEFIGHFVPSTGTPYKIEHYLMDEDGTYPSTPDKTEDDLKGTTGHTATATPLPEYATLYTYDASVSTASATINADGSTTLKLYYERNKFDVIYKYEGDIPANAPALPAIVDYYHGETVTVDTAPVVVEGYDFVTWHHHATEGEINIVGGQFTMPMRDVTLYGRFTARTDTKYTVEHYITELDNVTYQSTPYSSQTLEGTTGAEVTAQPITIAGFTYSDADSSTTKSGIITGDGQLTLKLYYKRNSYNVSYDYEGDTEGLDLPTLPTGGTFLYGETVDVEDKVSIADHEFHGWYVGTEDNIVEQFDMPARNVVILGHFVPDDATPYTVEHYLMDENGQYPSTPADTEPFQGTAGHYVEAKPLLKYDGYTYDDVKSTPTKSGEIATGLVLKLYYERDRFNVTYAYEGDIPANAPALPAIVDYYHGETVTVDTAPVVVEGYDFVTWHHHATEGEINIVGGQFTMPMRDVTLYGRFTARTDTKYTVEHYITELDNVTYQSTPYSSQTLEGTTGAEVTAQPITIAGFGQDTAYRPQDATGVITGDGQLVLKLYYKRNTYNVSYVYEGDLDDFTPPTLPTGGKYLYGQKVTVAPTVTLQGYSFIGWYMGDVNNHVTGSFTMPARNVILVGHFEPSENTGYSVSHYLQGLDGQYYIDGQPEYRSGSTGTPVYAVSKVYDGFEYYHGHPDTLTKGNIKADGSLELKFFYNRLNYDVEYVLDGAQPHGVTVTVPDYYNTTEPFGKQVDVCAPLAQSGYTFSGWSTEDAQVSGGKFDMPAKKVVFKGSFTANANTAYRVEYYLQKLNDEGNAVINEYALADYADLTATSGQLVTAEVKHFDGFTPKSDNIISAYVAGNGSTVIKVYYDRLLYNVEYHYYGDTPSCAPALPARVSGVPFGAKLSVEPDAVCNDSNHIFSGWASPHVTPVNNEYTVPHVTNATRTLMFYGMFEDMHEVIYDLNGGVGADGVDYSTVKYEHGTVVTIKDAPTKSRYTFTGWKADTEDHMPGDDHEVTADITFVAQWQYKGGGGGGTPVTRYTLTFESNGGTKYSPENYAEGTLVKLTKVPTKSGFVFDGWHLDEALTQDVTEVKMDKNITVYADWVEDNGGAGNGSPTPSVLNGDDHFAYIVGYENGTVRPENHITRAEVTTIFFRLLKDNVRNENLTSTNAFGDISGDAWYNTAISTMSAMGIVGGKASDFFAPGAYITRAEFAVICARFDDSDFEIVDEFNDVAGHWAEAEIHEAAAHGWIRGYDDGSFRPNELITRAEAVTMINRVLNRIPEKKEDLLGNMINWPDNTEDKWYYLAICEATNSHDFNMKNHVYETWTALKANPDWAQYQ